MCGILGIASKTEKFEETTIIGLRDLMTHRGPDNGGIWLSDNKSIALAHRRLAIIDLNKESNQPFVDESTNNKIIFNGEIYNFLELRKDLEQLGYVFKTSSDTEVILLAYDAWGTECLERFIGMFAFCIFDVLRNQFFLARDRAGEKPLFYSLTDNNFIFSSELKPILENGHRELNLDSLDCYLSFGYTQSNKSIISGVSKLPPAHAMIIDVETLEKKIWPYWQLPESNNSRNLIKEDILLDELEQLLGDAVEKQLISDVPVGVLLSGGVDSSLITAMAARAKEGVKTFTISFNEFKEYDESGHARLIADEFGTEHIELSANNPEPEILLSLARQYDEPMIDSSMLPTYLVSKLIKEHCTVALGGDGGDELFGGYSTHSRLLWTHQRTKYLPLSIRKSISTGASFLPYGFKGREWLRNLDFDFDTSLPLVSSHFDKNIRFNLFNNLDLGHFAENYRLSNIPNYQDLLSRMTAMDFKNYLPEDILVKVDRASMLNSLEIRAPFLDKRIIEFAFSKVHSRQKASSSERKILLKRLCERLLPSSFDLKRKQGFSIPLGAWLKQGPWRDFFYDNLKSSKIYNHRRIEELLDSQDKGRNNSERLFGLLMFQLWSEEYNIKIG